MRLWYTCSRLSAKYFWGTFPTVSCDGFCAYVRRNFRKPLLPRSRPYSVANDHRSNKPQCDLHECSANFEHYIADISFDSNNGLNEANVTFKWTRSQLITQNEVSDRAGPETPHREPEVTHLYSSAPTTTVIEQLDSMVVLYVWEVLRIRLQK